MSNGYQGVTMKRLALGALAAVLVLSSVAFVRSGGWAVVIVSKIPDHWTVGKPLQLMFTVRAHGQHYVPGLTPSVEARSGSRRLKGVTWEFREDGETGYRARLTFPEPGDWQVTINSGFGRSRAVLIPWRVVDSTAHAPADLSEPERGRRLFAAKGCVTCHVHRAVDIEGELKNSGPDLTERRFPADYLAKFLADPSIKPATAGMMRMPNLRLKEKDIIPIVAFINAQTRVAGR
jgi:cytochrome c553